MLKYYAKEDFMNQLFLILAIILILAAIYIYLTRKNKVGGKKNALWQECRRQLRLPPKLADETIERHIKTLRERHPNHSEEWYLEKIIYDLERDRR
jgi:hypothetical protein